MMPTTCQLSIMVTMAFELNITKILVSKELAIPGSD